MKNRRNTAAKALLYAAAAAVGLLAAVMGAAKLAGLLLPQMPGAQRQNEAAQRWAHFRMKKAGEARYDNG